MLRGAENVQKHPLRTFLHIFWVANFGGLNFDIIYTPFGVSGSLIYIYHGIYRHHRLLLDPPVRFLPPDSPFRHLPSQPGSVSIHKPPTLIEKSLDHINRVRVKTFTRGPLCHIKLIFVDLSITLLAPSPVQYKIVSKYYKNKLDELAISIGFSSQYIIMSPT